jgi:hypothetical protein
MLIGAGRAGPLAVDTLPAFVKEECGITGAGVKFRQVIRDQLEVDVVPRPGPNAISGVGHLIGKFRVPLDTEIRAPGAPRVTRRRSEPLTRRVRAGKAPEIASDARLARYKEAC